MPLVLIVEDESDLRHILSVHLQEGGHQTIQAADGKEALEKCREIIPDLIISDIMMPNMSGIDFFSSLRNESPELAAVPFIFLTAMAGEEEIVGGLRLGVDGYLTKPIRRDLLLATVSSRLNYVKRQTSHLQEKLKSFFSNVFDGPDQALGQYESVDLLLSHYANIAASLSDAKLPDLLLKEATFEVKSLIDAQNVSKTLANFCPDPDAALIGLAELIINGIEHGNLGIGYDLKTELLKSGTWAEETERRLALPENTNKFVKIIMTKTDKYLSFRIEDFGPGFESAPYLVIDAKRSHDLHGRGIALSKAVAFSDMEYIGSGNQIVARIDL